MTGYELKRELGNLGLTMAEAARRMGVNYTSLWRQTKRGSKKVSPLYAEVVRCWVLSRERNGSR